MIIIVQKDEANKQEIDIKWTPIQRANGRYQLLVAAKGMIEARFEATLTVTEVSGQFDVSVMANTPLGSVDVASSTMVRSRSAFRTTRRTGRGSSRPE